MKKLRFPDGIEIGSVCVLLDDCDNVLICKSTEGAGWIFPGGHLEAGETIKDCLVREIHEELAVEIDILYRLDEIEIIYTQENGNGRHVIIFPFIAKIKPGRVVKPDMIEISEIKWTTLDEAEKLLNKYYAKVIKPLKEWLIKR